MRKIVSFSKEKRVVKKGNDYMKLKRQVHERDNYTCVNPDCECKKNPTLPSINYLLTVFHVKHRGQWGSDVLENVVTACNYCHDLHHRGKLSNQFAIDYLEGLK